MRIGSFFDWGVDPSFSLFFLISFSSFFQTRSQNDCPNEWFWLLEVLFANEPCHNLGSVVMMITERKSPTDSMPVVEYHYMTRAV